MIRFLKKSISFFLAVAMLLTSVISISADNNQSNLSSVLIQSAVSYASANENREIDKTKTAYDFDGNTYTVVELSPIGYMILHDDTGDYAEYSATAPSPYIGYEADIYYTGIKGFYYKENNQYFHTITGEELVVTNLIVEACREISQSFQQKTARSYLTRAVAGTYVPSYSWLENANTTARISYVSGGYCGYIAGSLLLFYLEKTQSGTWVNSTYMSGGYLNGTGLTNKLIAVGQTLGYTGNSTWAYDINGILAEYLRGQSGLTWTCTWMIGGAGSVKTGVDLGLPTILFGNIPDVSAGGSTNHAVLAYGYTSGNSPIVHYGWAGYSNVTLSSGIIGSACTVTPW